MAFKNLLFIPAYRCEHQIGRVIAQLTPSAAQYFQTVLILDNQSPDATLDAAIAALPRASDFDIRVLRNRSNYGLGGSHKVAFEYALANGYDYVGVLHGDDQGTLQDLTTVMAEGHHVGLDALLGARFSPGSRLSGYSKFRTFGNHVFQALFSAVTRRRIWDLGSGLNLYRMGALQNRFWLGLPDDLTFNYGMILASTRLGHRIEFFPISWREDDQTSNVRLFHQASTVLRMLFSFAISPHRWMTTDHRTIAHPEYAADELARSNSRGDTVVMSCR
jgi:glycosyltransferase involved in cell wall biosynthesis